MTIKMIPKKSKKKHLVNISIKVDEDLLKKAKKLNINISGALHMALADMVETGKVEYSE
jgi:post-segregation antitoxin (ccd killing protein)